uniref:NADH dehydrogenase subunit 2 n=1 Tax=Urnula craterium TaxID=96586 RepID=UPI0022385FE6|nr:NADH dehydrogenase subunit 2 [Urnula craterium]UYF20384.1 NADH dehydrogenase subunit 2 [Urnula craterium]
MLILYSIFLLVVSAVSSRREFTILLNRVTIIILSYSCIIVYDSLCVTYLDTGIGIYNGLFHSTAVTQSFGLFVYIISGIILLLTAFYPRWIQEPWLPANKADTANKERCYSKGKIAGYKNVIMGKTAPQYTILEYPLIMLFIITGAILLMSSSDLVSMFLAIELQSYGLYIFATLYRNSEWSTSAGLTYFLLGGLSSCFILLGSALLYASCGLTSLDGIYVFYNIISEIDPISTYPLYVKPEIFSMGFLIMSVGYLFKVSAAPFHFWSPDVYDAIPTIVTTFVAIIAKISIFIFLLELVYNTSQTIFGFNWTYLLLVSSFLSLIIGTTVGLVQFRIKRLLAYSTISHVGFILLALAINSIESVQAFLFYLMQYSLSNLNIFFIIILIGYSLVYYKKNKYFMFEEMEIENSPIQLIKQLNGYFHLNPVLALSLAITIFSFIGVPPLIGFFAKQMVLSAALQNGYYFLALIAILTSVIGAVYYLNIIKAVFFDTTEFKLINNFDYKTEDDEITTIKIPTYKNYFKINPLNKTVSPDNLSYLVLSSSLTITVSGLTLVILLFIIYPQVWLSSANILAMILLTI